MRPAERAASIHQSAWRRHVIGRFSIIRRHKKAAAGEIQRRHARNRCKDLLRPEDFSGRQVKRHGRSQAELSELGARQHPEKSFFGSTQLPCWRAQQIPYKLTSSSSDLLFGVTRICSFYLRTGRVYQHGQIHMVNGIILSISSRLLRSEPLLSFRLRVSIRHI